MSELDMYRVRGDDYHGAVADGGVARTLSWPNRSISRIDRASHRTTRDIDQGASRTASPFRAPRRRPMAFTMDALGAMSSDSDDEDEDEAEEDARGGAAPRAGAREASAATEAVDYEAITRHGFRAGASVLGLARAGDVGATAWGKKGARDGRYDAAESAEVRYKAGAGLDATCGKALEAAAAKAAEAEERRRKSREEAALSKARYMEAKQALRDADRAARRATVAVVEDETEGVGAKRRKRVEASSKDDEKSLLDAAGGDFGFD